MLDRAAKKKKDAEKRQKRKEEDLIDLIYDKDFSVSKVPSPLVPGRC